jgi:gas vesicle structural protein
MTTNSTRPAASSSVSSRAQPRPSEHRSGLPRASEGHNQVSLCEVLDRVLNKGVVVVGDIIISVADVDLIYLGLQVVLTSVETANRHRQPAPTAPARQEGSA